MRALLSVFTLALAAGCAADTTAPDVDAAPAELAQMASFAYGAAGVGDPSDAFMERLAALPPELALTAAQRAQIDALLAEFVTATAADREALAGIMAEARTARQGGATREQVQAILAAGAEPRQRMAAAQRDLRAAVFGVLTPAQRAALSGRTQTDRGPCSTLTEAQRNEISALRAAFEQTFAADIATVRSVRERVHAARQTDASREAVRALMAEAREPMQRLHAGRVALRDAVQAVLTPEQRAAGCLR